MISKEQKHYMQMAVDLSLQSVDSKKGGPFGAVIIKEDKIVGASGNCVFKLKDPTAHAEMMAIRDACQNLDTVDLTGCVIYSSGEPCPMCMSAIYWSGIKEIYYANTEDEAMDYGFVDKAILAELRKPKGKRKLPPKRIKNEDALKVFDRALKNHV